MKGCSAFPKAPVLLEPHHQIVKCHIQALGEAFTPSTEMQLAYSTAPTNRAISVRVPSTSQIYLFKNYPYSIG